MGSPRWATSKLNVVLLAMLACVDARAADSPAARVRSIEVDVPDAERRRLLHYVELSPGQPLDPDLVRHAVEMIHATGIYEDVQVFADTTPEGVDIVIRPIRGPLLADIEVAGPSPIDATDVRRIGGLRNGEPLWPARIESVAQACALRLADRGYLEALVTGEVVRRPEGALARFTVRAGPAARIGKVSVVSDPSVALAPHPLEEGEVFRRGRAQEAAQAITRRLRRRGHWRASVQLQDTYDPGAATVAVVFRVDAGPRMEAGLRGAPVPRGTRSAVVELLREGTSRTDAADEAADRIEDSLRRSGHRNVEVRVREEALAGRVKIVFDIAAAPATRVRSVRVDGADFLSLPLKTRAGRPLADADADEDVQSLIRALQERGYAEPRVDVDIPEETGGVPVVFRVLPGVKTEVSSFEVLSPVTLPAARSARELRCQPGRPYRARDVVADRNAVLAAYRNAGYLSASVRSNVRFSDLRSQAAVVLEVTPGPQTRLDHIVISGLQHTREAIVRRELQLEEGDPLGLGAVLESQRRLGSLDIFGNVGISEVDPESVDRRSLIVSVEERARASLAVALGYSERDLVRLSAEVTRRNIGGLDRSMTLFVRGSFRGMRFFTTFREPYLFGRRQELFITGFREEEKRETFEFVRYGLLLETVRRLTPSLSVIARYATQRTRSFNIRVPVEEIDKSFLSATVAGPSFSLIHDTRDDALDPRRGHFIGGDAQLSHRALGGESFMKAFVQASFFGRVAPRLLVAGNGRVGLARTFGDEPPRLPLPDRFFAGGPYSLRGFDVDRAGPLEAGTSEPLVPTGGNALLLASAELRFDASRYVALAAFGDAGNVYPLAGDVTLADVRYSAGVGVRYKSAFGPIRLDWAIKLNRRGDESRSKLHFTIGHAF